MTAVDGPSERDAAIIRLVAQLGHVTSRHVHELLFLPHTTSRTPCIRALSRLTAARYLDRVEKRPLGGTRGGSAYYVYRLGSRGHYLDRDEPFRVRRQAVGHSLLVADVVVIIRHLERQGLPVAAIHHEPDCHVSLGGEDLKPDLFLELGHPSGYRHRLWIEADNASQGPKRMMQKFQMYTRAHTRLSESELAVWEPWPLTVFVTVDDERAKELLYLLRDVPDDLRPMFRVTTREGLPRLLSE